MTKCFEVLKDVSREVCSTYKNKREAFEAVNWISNICNMIDTISYAYGGIAYDVSFNPDTFDITIALECEEVVVDGFEEPNNIYDVIESSKKFTVYHGSGNDLLVVEFVFDGIWEDVVE